MDRLTPWMRAYGLFVLALTVLFLPTCSSPGPLAPERRASAAWIEPLDGQADFVATVDVAGIRRDPLYGALLEAMRTNANARYAHLTTATRIDIAGHFNGKKLGLLVAIVRGVETDANVKEDNELFRAGPGTWVLVSPPSPRVRAVMSRAGYALPEAWSSDSDVLFELTARQNEAARAHAATVEERAIAKEVEWGSLSVYSSARRQIVARAHFTSSSAASDAEVWLRGRLLVYARNEIYAELLRKLVSLDIDRSGSDLVVRVRFSEALVNYAIRAIDRSRDRDRSSPARAREITPEPPRAPPAPYASQCPPGKRFDTDRGCVDAR